MGIPSGEVQAVADTSFLHHGGQWDWFASQDGRGNPILVLAGKEFSEDPGRAPS